MSNKKVRVGSLYAFNPVGMDVWASNKVDLETGSIVRVVNKHGCPPANTMGHCYVELLDKTFIGMVLCNSLAHVVRSGKGFAIK